MQHRLSLTALVTSAALLLPACGDPPDPGETTEGPSDGTTAGTTSGGGSESDGSTEPVATTTAASCGDGQLDPGEDCDDGDDVDGDGCEADCTLTPECGDGVVEGDEECDDGNEIDNDACTNACLHQLGAICGDGVLEDSEKCDDGNNEPDDGCEPDCVPTEPGVCGDGVKAFDEACDDGNDVNNDGCQNDCSPTPAEVCQPIPQNEEPDPYAPCDGALDPSDPLAPFQAMELGCSDLVNQALLIDEHELHSPDPDAWRIAKGFGSHEVQGQLVFSPRKGESFLMISTGLIEPTDEDGVVLEDPSSQASNNDNGNDNVWQLPPPLSPDKGSNDGGGGDPFNACDGVNDCSDTLEDPWYNDFEMQILNRLWLRFKATPPEQTAGWSMRLVFCSSEYSFVNTPYNDLFIIWQVNEHFTGNVAFIDGDALTVSSLAPYLATDGYTMNHPALDDTGFEGQACTDWLTVRHNVAAGEPLEVAFFIADTFDQIQATVAIFDDFRWRCDACTPGDAQACAVAVPPAGCCGVGLD
ncbi:MAG: DUF4215 domain-containing protein [Myxococcales bacterium]|nr:DUF4215 domain-containing protein [Myxococcales bacterium]